MVIINSTDMTAWSTVILAIITFVYVILTHNILKEQRKSIKIAALERKLEKVYSPLVETKTGLNFGNLDSVRGIPDTESIERAYLKFAKKLSEVSENYGHLLDQDIIQNHSEIWNMTNDDSFIIAGYINERKKYDILIEDFNKDVMARKNKYKIELNKLEGNF